MEFRWNDWNLEHIGRHGVSPLEAEHAVDSAALPFPTHREDDKWLVWGRTAAGRMLQVVYVLDENDCVFVIHARPLTENEKKRFRKQPPK